MSADSTATILLTLGLIFLAGLTADVLGRRTRLPRVTLLLLLGVCVGPLGLGAIPASSAEWYPFITDLALVMVAFLLGGELTWTLLRKQGRAILVISLVVVIVTTVVVAAGLLALGWPAPVALLLGAIGTSTAPAAVSDVVHETGARGPFTKMLLGIVAIDDAWGIVMVSIVLAWVLGTQSPDAASHAVMDGAIEIGGAILVGGALGVPMAFLTGRVRAGEPTQAEALGCVFLCAGVALLLEVSFLLAAMTMGMVVANVARHHLRPFRAIEGIEWPFMVLFFVLSGATFRVTDLGATATLVCGYVLLRVVGRVAGGWLGAVLSERVSSAPAIGAALLPQAGVAIGLALVVSQRLPEVGGTILTATVAGTIVFEIAGPILTRWALVREGEAKAH